MNKSDIYLFDCLTSDLDCSRLTPCEPKVYGSLRSELLTLVQIENYGTYETAQKAFCSNFQREFKCPFGLLENLQWECRHSMRYVVSFRDIYQLLSFVLKVKEKPSELQEYEYVSKFIETEKQTRAWRRDEGNPLFPMFRSILRYATRGLDLSRSGVELYCQHGPGAVYCKAVGADKNSFNTEFRSLALEYPQDWFFANLSMYWNASDYVEECKLDFLASPLLHVRLPSNGSVSHIQSSDDGPLSRDAVSSYKRPVSWFREDYIKARLTLVPKDYRGPRGVFINPKEAVFCQIGIANAINEWFGSSLFKDAFDPFDQTPSQEAALAASANRDVSTADLSDASDRVPLALVSYGFHRRHYLVLARSRPSHVVFPQGDHLREHSGRLHKLSMFAPMGAGTCFPCLTLAVLALCLASVSLQEGHDIAYVSARKCLYKSIPSLIARSNLRVFGDDVIIGSKYYAGVVKALEASNLKVNVRKSYSTGLFRESCGMDALSGHVVTPVRLRASLSSDDVEAPLTWIALHNHLVYKRSACRKTIRFLREHITSRYSWIGWTNNHLVNPNCLLSDDCRLTWILNSLSGNLRVNEDLQCLEVRTARMQGLQYPCSADRRCDLNYALFPKGRKGIAVQWTTTRTPVVTGSRLQADADDAMLLSVGLRTKRRRDMLVPSWVPVNLR